MPGIPLPSLSLGSTATSTAAGGNLNASLSGSTIGVPEALLMAAAVVAVIWLLKR